VINKTRQRKQVITRSRI